MPLFSYVVDHDDGLSPNPSGGFCTLAFCKYSTSGRANVVELAQEGDWVVGTSGLGRRSVGEHGRLIYAMRITGKLTLRDYFRDPRFVNRTGNEYDLATRTDRFALFSDHFFYFGRKAPKIASRFVNHDNHPIEKRGRGFRRRFDENFVTNFVAWLTSRYETGVHGAPCGPPEETGDEATLCRRTRPCSPRPKRACVGGQP